jgi:hypothetical protein
MALPPWALLSLCLPRWEFYLFHNAPSSVYKLPDRILGQWDGNGCCIGVLVAVGARRRRPVRVRGKKKGRPSDRRWRDEIMTPYSLSHDGSGSWICDRANKDRVQLCWIWTIDPRSNGHSCIPIRFIWDLILALGFSSNNSERTIPLHLDLLAYEPLGNSRITRRPHKDSPESREYLRRGPYLL